LAYEKIKLYNKSQKQLDLAFNKGNLSKEQYDKFTNELLRLIFEAKKEGGII
jgi:polyhydroxyalkanoate synthesis regulator phasin